jgi:hypothetical protein
VLFRGWPTCIQLLKGQIVLFRGWPNCIQLLKGQVVLFRGWPTCIQLLKDKLCYLEVGQPAYSYWSDKLCYLEAGQPAYSYWRDKLHSSTLNNLCRLLAFGNGPKFVLWIYISFLFWWGGGWCWWGGECFDHDLKAFLATSCFISVYLTWRFPDIRTVISYAFLLNNLQTTYARCRKVRPALMSCRNFSSYQEAPHTLAFPQTNQRIAYLLWMPQIWKASHVCIVYFTIQFQFYWSTCI